MSPHKGELWLVRALLLGVLASMAVTGYGLWRLLAEFFL